MSNRQIDKIKKILKKYRVLRASLFGSAATGKTTKNSDVDLLVEFSGKRSLLDLAGLKLDLEQSLKKDVDVLTYSSIHPLLKKRILSEQVAIL
jgi:predicted nucleotidyltransferase